MSLHFHHIGVACQDLDSEAIRFSALGYQPEGTCFTDPIQGVTGQFLTGGGPRLELLSSLSVDGVLAPWLKAGVKLYHLAYEASDFEAEISGLQHVGAKVMVKPVQAVAFGMRRIAFLMAPNSMLIELISMN